MTSEDDGHASQKRRPERPSDDAARISGDVMKDGIAKSRSLMLLRRLETALLAELERRADCSRIGAANHANALHGARSRSRQPEQSSALTRRAAQTQICHAVSENLTVKSGAGISDMKGSGSRHVEQRSTKDSPSSAAMRMRELRKRRRRGIVGVVPVHIFEREINALVSLRLLPQATSFSRADVQRALHELLDRALGEAT